MRAQMVLALLAFLAVSFVAARPAEDGQTGAVVDGDADTDNEDSVEEESQVGADEDSSEDEDAIDEDVEDEDNNKDEADEEDGDNEDTGENIAITVPAPKKKSPPFWPRLGGHGPVVFNARPRVHAVA
ncbi:nucleoplasmin-like protein ANO39 [Drosophila subobscura]|uniref:nucleoplasmin-like protein ANO39 n=1 Tax=Drosophila subobscura TaxID=7241 RepID=UPI00155A3039|nr:nucleoplasmin-like protein ANO39 [Drosophila subobscura]